jgi:hypothetical protein
MCQLTCVYFLEWFVTKIDVIFFFPFLHNFASDDWLEAFFLMNWSKSFPNTVVIVYQMIQKTWTNILIMFQNVSTDLCGFFRMVCNTNRFYITFSHFYKSLHLMIDSRCFSWWIGQRAFPTQWWLFTRWFKKLEQIS